MISLIFRYLNTELLFGVMDVVLSDEFVAALIFRLRNDEMRLFFVALTDPETPEKKVYRYMKLYNRHKVIIARFSGNI